MNINRHNYEEFFILYWDNELSATQKKEVERFVEQNKDVKELFQLFGETRFSPDESKIFAEKELLKIEEDSAVNFSNYSELLYSYIDDELLPEQKESFENFIAKNPAVQTELSVLKRTKLQPDTEIVFPDKSILFKKEEKVRVIYFSWTRLAVAAILLLMAGLITFRLVNNNKKDGTPLIAKQNAPVETKKEYNAPNKNEIAAIQPENKLTKPAIKKSAKPVFVKDVQNNIASNDNKNNLPKEKNISEQTQIALNTDPQLLTESGFTEKNKVNNDAIAFSEEKKKIDLFENITVTERPSPSYTVYNPSESEQEKTDKGGLKGFLRKATRVFEQRTKMQATTDDNKLLVGMFAVSLK